MKKLEDLRMAHFHFLYCTDSVVGLTCLLVYLWIRTQPTDDLKFKTEECHQDENVDKPEKKP